MADRSSRSGRDWGNTTPFDEIGDRIEDEGFAERHSDKAKQECLPTPVQWSNWFSVGRRIYYGGLESIIRKKKKGPKKRERESPSSCFAFWL